MNVTGLSVALVVLAMGGIVGSQIYLHVTLRDAPVRRSVEHWVLLCAIAAVLGFGIATMDCVAGGQCFTPQRADASAWP